MKSELLHATRHERRKSALSTPPADFSPSVTGNAAAASPSIANASSEDLPEDEGFEICASHPLETTGARPPNTSVKPPPAHDAFVDTQEPPDRAPPAVVAPDTTHDPLPVTRSRPKTWPPILPPEDGELPNPGDRVRHYEVIRELGRGGMGAVYEARDTKLGRKVAIKFLTDTNSELRQRFLQEARTTAKCTHPNIVQIHENGEYQNYPFMVLEHLTGQTLQSLIKEGQLTPQRAVSLAIPIVRALACAHAEGIVHRDLKPSNIMITHKGIVKVLDFGIAKILAQPRSRSQARPRNHSLLSLTHTRDGVFIGTVPYMAPEQINNQTIDHRTDIWAMGIVMAEMVMGKHPLVPFSQKKIVDVGNLERPMTPMHQLLPQVGKLGAIIDRCLVKPQNHRTSSAEDLLAELEAFLPMQIQRRLDDEYRPFPGLAAFQESDADRFFGRDDDVAHLLAQLSHTPWVTVAGASGTGKSSLVRAGVIPALKQSGEGWEAEIIRPGHRPLSSLANLLIQFGLRSSSGTTEREAPTLDHETFQQRLRAEPGYLGTELRAWAAKKLRRVVLFVDQLEELYTLTEDPEERACFLACLAGVADDAASPLRVVTSVRSDFLDRMAEDSRFMNDIVPGLMLLPPMGQAGLQDALQRPIEAAGYRFETPKLVTQMLHALNQTPNPLPLLQFAGNQLWDARDKTEQILTHDSYQAIGGVEGALAVHADQVLAKFSPGKQGLVRLIFQRLVTPDRTRDIASLRDLRSLPVQTGELNSVLDELVRVRLLSIETGASDDASVEIVHESLIEGWPTLRKWLDEDHEHAEFLSRLRHAAQQWERSGCKSGLLWRDETAEDAERWARRYRKPLAQNEREFLDAVLGLAHQSRRRKQVIMRMAFSLLVIITMSTATLSGWAWSQKQQADAARLEAYQATEAANDARALAEQAAEQAQEARQKALDAADRERQANVGLREAIRKERQAKRRARQARRAAVASRRRAIQAAKQAKQERERAVIAAEKARLARIEAERLQVIAEKSAVAEKRRANHLQRKLAGQLAPRLPKVSKDLVSQSPQSISGL